MQRIVVDAHAPDRAALAPAAEALRSGRLVAFPTETVYGLGGAAFDPQAVEAIFAAKGRPRDDPLIVHVPASFDAGALFAEVTPTIQGLMDAHWPGPLTIVARKRVEVPDRITAGHDTVAVRSPGHPVASALLELAAVPVAAPSANRFSYVSPTTADHVAADLGGSVDVIVDAGPTPIGIESTIVAVEGSDLRVLRRGSIVVDGAREDDAAPASASAGRSVTHYAPSTPTTAVAAHARIDADSVRGAYIGYDDSVPPPGWVLTTLGERDDLATIAGRLYAVLREADRSPAREILIELTGRGGIGEAIDDRIRRAAGGTVRS